MMIRLEAKGKKEGTVGKTITQKLIEAHLVSGRIEPGSEIGIRIDQTLTQDATGTMAYLQFEAMGIDRVRTELSMSYIDHNTIQIGFENADDHRYLQSVARRYGIRLSRAGNGICHQVHLERFGKPGKTLLGSDSHTSTCGALGMLAIGAGGLDVALAMAGEPFFLHLPEGDPGQPHGKTPPLGLGQGRHPEAPGDLHDEGQRGPHLRVRRRGPGKSHGTRAGHHRQHGGRAGPHHLRLPERRDDAALPGGRGTAGTTGWSLRPTPMPNT